MFELTEVKQLAQSLDSKLPFLHEINSPAEHSAALEVIEQLIEEYDDNVFLIDALSASIERYENTAPEFAEFNADIEQLDSGVSMLRVLMDQKSLKTSDFENEIGKKSMVSMILSGKRKLSLDHIYKLAGRFSLSPKLFV